MGKSTISMAIFQFANCNSHNQVGYLNKFCPAPQASREMFELVQKMWEKEFK